MNELLRNDLELATTAHVDDAIRFACGRKLMGELSLRAEIAAGCYGLAIGPTIEMVLGLTLDHDSAKS